MHNAPQLQVDGASQVDQLPQSPEFVPSEFVYPFARAIPAGEKCNLFESYTGHGSSSLSDARAGHAYGSAFDRRSKLRAPSGRDSKRTVFLFCNCPLTMLKFGRFRSDSQGTA